MRIAALIIAIALAGCSTIPVTEQTAQPVPAARIFVADDVGLPAGDQSAEVSFYRDAGMLGSGCNHDLYVNNVKVFAIRPSEYIHLRLKPGAYFFRLETGRGLCPNIATSQDATLAPGDKLGYRILLPSDGSLRLTRIE